MKILYLCKHNRCRSILCEAITNQIAAPLLKGYSAGSQPTDAVHPAAMAELHFRGYDTRGLASQSWDAHLGSEIDLVVTVSDSAAIESCPPWLGDTPVVHWPLPDPIAQTSELACAELFDQVVTTIVARVDAMLEVGLHNLAGEQRRAALDRLIAEWA